MAAAQVLDPLAVIRQLEKQGLTFFTGVPDSLLKELCAAITDILPKDRHIIAANEGGAVGLAAGYHLATGKAAVVYMQNSGTGNAINPLLSLADPEVYSIPMMLFIGWRGEPGVKDEPQHVKQGRVQEALLAALEYPVALLSQDPTEAAGQIEAMAGVMEERQSPVVFLVKKGTFANYKAAELPAPPYPMSREEALGILLECLSEKDKIVSTTGKASRELYELREARGEDHSRDFLTVGSMGHTGMIALGLAKHNGLENTEHSVGSDASSLSAKDKQVFCVDGDGAALMHLGNLALAAKEAPSHYWHLVINNGSHDSVGGQPTIGFEVSFDELARTLGFATSCRVESAEELRQALVAGRNERGPHFIEVRVNKGSRSDLGRPKTSPGENKRAFMEDLV